MQPHASLSRFMTAAIAVPLLLSAAPATAAPVTYRYFGEFGPGDGSYEFLFTFDETAMLDGTLMAGELITASGATTDGLNMDGFAYTAAGNPHIFLTFDGTTPGAAVNTDGDTFSFLHSAPAPNARAFILHADRDLVEEIGPLNSGGSGIRSAGPGTWEAVLVPEPTSLAMLGLGGLAVLRRRARR